jgi:hypothetical protein
MTTMEIAPRPALGPDVPLIEWPIEEERRQDLAAAGLPRLLVVSRGQPPPRMLDVLEDWVRAPADVSEVMARQATLRARVPTRQMPTVDEHGLLWFGASWVSVPPSQLGVVRQLVDGAGRLVAADDLRCAYAADGGNPDSAAMKAVMVRLGRRVNDVGLRLHNIRGRGYLLEVPRGLGAT